MAVLCVVTEGTETPEIKIEWAETCSKPHPGEFGGGCVRILDGKATWVGSRSLADLTPEGFRKIRMLIDQDLKVRSEELNTPDPTHSQPLS